MPRKIKKYANRKLYDTMTKKYISLDEISELIKAGEEVFIEDNETGEDLTSSIVSQLLAREKTGNGKEVSSVLINLLRKSSGTVIGYARKYSSQWQNVLNTAEDEVDKLVRLLVKSKELSESEGSKLKKELLGFSETFKKWVSEKVDQRVNDTLNRMNLATKDQVVRLTARLEELTQTVERLERSQTGKKGDLADKH